MMLKWLHLHALSFSTSFADKEVVKQDSYSYLDIAKIDQWLSAKAAHGLHQLPPDIELASALELCDTISGDELSFQQVC